MFAEGELIIYGNTGVCRVEGIGHPAGVRGINADRLYYTLTPIYQAGVIYAPVDTPVFMRPVLSRQEAEELISRIPVISGKECPSRDQKLLSSHYQGFLESHRCEDLIQLIKTVYSRSKRSQAAGRKPSQVDQLYLKRAEGLLYGEFAVALGIEPSEVVPYISRRIDGVRAGS